jgi:hypothetical protein
MKQTSRQWVMDLIEAIINQIQLASHLQELIDFEESDNLVNKFLLDQSVKLRRDMMSQLPVENQDYRCVENSSENGSSRCL